MTPAPAIPPVLDGIAAWSQGYDVILCDIWGVLHDGVQSHPAAADALFRIRQRGGTVILVSNAPRPAYSVVPHLDELGVPRHAWDGIVTSGDVTRAVLEASHEPYFWLGPERDYPLFEGLAARSATLEEAPVLVCTGLLHDERETPDDYREILARARARGVTFLCANPDLVVERGGELVFCAGALAEAYADLGGEVIFAGKPHKPIYDAALDVAASLRKRDTDMSKVLAIGDALENGRGRSRRDRMRFALRGAGHSHTRDRHCVVAAGPCQPRGLSRHSANTSQRGHGSARMVGDRVAVSLGVPSALGGHQADDVTVVDRDY